MAYIKPTSEIYLFEDIKINSSYDDTFTFFNKDGVWDSTAQATWFLSKRYVTLTDYSFVGEGIIRVKGAVGNYEKVNYMMFKNSDFSNKWFYAFVNSVEYTNPGTTTLYYTLDVMQTWLGELEILPSLVDREHVEDDSLYANLEPEGISVNERIPFSKPYNLEGVIGEKIMVLGFTENPFDIVYSKPTIPYDPSALLTPNYNIYNISNENVRYSYTDKAFVIESDYDSLTEFTFEITFFTLNTSIVADKQKKRCYKDISGIWEFETLEEE